MKEIRFKGYAHIEEHEVKAVIGAIEEALFDLPYLIDIQFTSDGEIEND